MLLEVIIAGVTLGALAHFIKKKDANNETIKFTVFKTDATGDYPDYKYWVYISHTEKYEVKISEWNGLQIGKSYIAFRNQNNFLTNITLWEEELS